MTRQSRKRYVDRARREKRKASKEIAREAFFYEFAAALASAGPIEQHGKTMPAAIERAADVVRRYYGPLTTVDIGDAFA